MIDTVDNTLPAQAEAALATAENANSRSGDSVSQLGLPARVLSSAFNSQLSALNPQLQQPVSDIPAYLSVRKPVADFADEDNLYVTLPAGIRDEVRSLLGACKSAQSLVKRGLSVTKACDRAYTIYRSHLGVSLSTFRNEYFDKWTKSGDWVTLVNRTRAGSAWQDRDGGLPSAFLQFCASRFALYKRPDAKKQALNAIKRQWLTGRNERGEREPIPGYGFRPENADSEFPPGWSYTNILRQIKARNAFPKAVQALAHEGTSSARQFLPGVLTTRVGLRFMQIIDFDDLRLDWRVVDPLSRKVCDLWILVARDRATNICLGFGLRPARVRDDGTQEHLKLTDMKQLLAWLMERFGLPPYTVHFILERGTATVGKGTALALRELPGTCPDGSPRIVCHYTSMIGGASPLGYAERKIGNSKGKASLESTHRLNHTIGSCLPAQIGNTYARRPQELAARERETIAILESMPPELLQQARYPMLTLAEARTELVRIYSIQNTRTEHDLEGFDDVLEWWDGKAWQPRHTYPGGDVQVRTRRESPIERAAKLCQGVAFTPVSPQIITAFYEHTARPVTVEPDGQIVFRHDNRDYIFRCVGAAPVPGTKLIGYHHPEDPTFLHVTDGKGSYKGCWIKRSADNDPEALANAMHYAGSALKAARETAEVLVAPERRQLEDMRSHNAELLQSHTFEAVATVGTLSTASQIYSPIAAAIASGADVRAAAKAAAKERARDAQDAQDLLRKAML